MSNLMDYKDIKIEYSFYIWEYLYSLNTKTDMNILLKMYDETHSSLNEYIYESSKDWFEREEWLLDNKEDIAEKYTKRMDVSYNSLPIWVVNLKSFMSKVQFFISNLRNK